MTPPPLNELELAARPGMESLRRECPQTKGYINGHLHRKRSDDCHYCQGRGWLPLPPAEQLGALIRVALMLGFVSLYGQPVDLCCARITRGGYTLGYGEGPTPEAALVGALLAPTQELKE